MPLLRFERVTWVGRATRIGVEASDHENQAGGMPPTNSRNFGAGVPTRNR